MDTDNPLISIVVSVLNNAKTMQHCMDSVAEQAYPQKELVIMDGESSDGTVEILQANDEKIAFWESKPDTGIYHAWNKALAHAKGEWICFIGADDYLWEPTVLSRMAPHLAMAKSQGRRIAYGQVALVSSAAEKLLYIDAKPWEQARKHFREYMTYTHSGSFHHRDLFADHGGFDESFRICGDYDLVLRELKDLDALYVPDLVVVGMRFGGVSSSLGSRLRMVSETGRARRNNGIRGFSCRLFLWRVRLLLLLGMRRLLGDSAARAVADWYRLTMGKRPAWKE